MLNKISRFGCCFFLFGQKLIFSDCRSMFARRVIQQIIGTNIRLASSSAQTDGEKKLIDILKNRFTKAKLINVKDTSCKYDFIDVHCSLDRLGLFFLYSSWLRC